MSTVHQGATRTSQVRVAVSPVRLATGVAGVYLTVAHVDHQSIPWMTIVAVLAVRTLHSVPVWREGLATVLVRITATIQGPGILYVELALLDLKGMV